MDTDFAETQARYAETLGRVPDYIKSTLAETDDARLGAAQKLLDRAARVITTGTGSSLPAAGHGAAYLQKQGRSAFFLATGAMLHTRLSPDDVVILCSQGWNRADAIAITKHVLDTSGAHCILLTANREVTANPRLHTLYFDPSVEKLFCRPAGVVTNLLLMEKLVADSDVSAERASALWQEGVDGSFRLDPDTRYVVLSSDTMMPAAWNVALAIREGAGVLSQLFDTETYAHGNYVADLRHREEAGTPFTYVFVTGGSTSSSYASFRRFLPFAEHAKVPYLHLNGSEGPDVLSSLRILGSVSREIYEANQRSGYNMNRPPGKEQNRYYHEMDSFELR